MLSNLIFRNSQRLSFTARRASNFAFSSIPDGKGRTVVVGMSGGVDSSVSAYLLKNAGYNVKGVFMRNWDEADERGKQCTTDRDRKDVAVVAKKLGIEWHEVDFVKEYWQNVFQRVIDGYTAGKTPNPDVLCNRYIKFSSFLNHAWSLGADFVATGHYAQTRATACGIPELHMARDLNKDQTFFLAAVPGTQLQKIIFPVGGLMKSEVRQIAESAGLSVAAKKESMGLCFVGKRDWGEFISDYVTLPPAKIVHLETNEQLEIGSLDNICCFTIGQKARIGGQKDKLYICRKDARSNVVTVAPGRHHPALYTRTLVTQPAFWIAGAPPSNSFSCTYRIRHRQDLGTCIVNVNADGTLLVTFDKPQRAVAPLQAVVLYHDTVCLGSALIESVGKSLYEEGISGQVTCGVE